MSVDSGTIMEFALKYPVNVRALPPKGRAVRLEANEGQRLKLAHNHALVQIDSFVGNFQISPWNKRGVRLEGRICADIVQRCVVSGDLLPAHIDVPVEVVFMPPESDLAVEHHQQAVEIILDHASDDATEVFSGNIIDIGAVAEEFFDLALDPYPRKEGTEFAPITIGNALDAEENKPSPFASLATLK